MDTIPFVPGDEHWHLLRVVMGERVGTLYLSHPDHAIVADRRLQEVFVLKDENYEDFEQLNN